MNNRLFIQILTLTLLLLISCQTRKMEVKQKSEVNTIEEIKVYNDFIDQAYKVYYCHLEMDSPKEYQSYNQNLSMQELDAYKKKYENYLRKYYEMLDTLQITAIVPDSLLALQCNQSYVLSKLDSIHRTLFGELLLDTISLESASFCLESLKGEKTYFERMPLNIPRDLDWDNMQSDTLDKYSHMIEEFCQSHFGKPIDNKYYVGFIDLSRVKFNRDSTLCFLECGYIAQSKCGYGQYYFLKKVNGKWTVITTIGTWVS